MKGVLVVSHGRLAEGLADSVNMFMGDVEQFDYLCLLKEDNALEFGSRILEKCKELDTGDGVIVLADLLGGTPSNQTVPMLNENLDLLTGMNFPMVLELLSRRMMDDALDLSEFVTVGRNGIINAKEFLSANDDDDE